MACFLGTENENDAMRIKYLSLFDLAEIVPTSRCLMLRGVWVADLRESINA